MNLNPSNTGEHSGVSLLVVGDNQAFLHVMEVLLKKHGEFESIQISNGMEAIQQAHLLNPEMILVDLDMSEANGLEVLRQLKRCAPRSGLIGLTLLENYAYRQMVLAAGGDDFLSKARLSTDLLPSIRRILPAKGIEILFGPELERPATNTSQ
ncbi:MAG TPA: response regulator [Anaerolineales bacterium]|jgi:DNA-binding NarL/FixJ family response regulator|nr:response regulator [Anaerolineales bacterium]